MDNATHPTARIMAVASLVAIVAALYFAQEFLMPIALAMFVSFLLALIVNHLNHRGMRRIPAVVIVVVLAVAAVGWCAWLMTSQVSSPGARLPEYKENIKKKAQVLEGPVGHFFSRVQDATKEINEGFPPPPRKQSGDVERLKRRVMPDGFGTLIRTFGEAIPNCRELAEAAAAKRGKVTSR